MKATLLLFLVLIGAGASAQTVSISKLYRSGADAPMINNQRTNNGIALGCLKLYTENPLVVAGCPKTAYINRASVVVNAARSALTVDFKEDIPKQRVTIAISYEDGQLLQSQSFSPKEKEQTVSLTELKATGLYASRYNIAVYQEDKRVLYWGQFVK